MRIQFDYKNPSSETIEAVIEFFKEWYTTNNNEHLEIGKINVYIDLKDKKTGDSVSFTNLATSKETMWVVKHKEMKKTNKTLIAHSTDEEEEFYVYRG